MPFLPWTPTLGSIAPPLPVAQGGTGAITAAAALAALGGQVLQAASAVGGTALINGTQTILSWTAPNDGNLHYAQAVLTQDVTVAETGGQLVMNYTDPAGTTGAPALIAGNQATGAHVGNQIAVCKAGTVVSISQNTALTAGTATVWGQIWGI